MLLFPHEKCHFSHTNRFQLLLTEKSSETALPFILKEQEILWWASPSAPIPASLLIKIQWRHPLLSVVKVQLPEKWNSCYNSISENFLKKIHQVFFSTLSWLPPIFIHIKLHTWAIVITLSNKFHTNKSFSTFAATMLSPIPFCFFNVTVIISGSFLNGWAWWNKIRRKYWELGREIISEK